MRAFVLVLDACGVGALPDAADYGDAGADTLVHFAQAAGGFDLPVLQGLGLGNIAELSGVPASGTPVVHGRLHPLGPGKDTMSGHWELMGIVPPVPLRTYPHGFPDDVLEALIDGTGRGILANHPANGLEVIERYGLEHVVTGNLIVYTSADSVLQIAAHEDVVDLDELYSACAVAREVMQGEHAVGRVIARPFAGEPGHFARTPRRRDLALEPPGRSYLQELQEQGVPVHAVGKVADVFSGIGIDAVHPGADNGAALSSTDRLVDGLEEGLVFVNLVDTDQVYGHRHDADGFHAALREVDAALGSWLARLDPARDLLVVTADHGVDPVTPGSDHTREHVPLLAWFDGHGGQRHDGPMADVGASALRWLTGREAELPGESFL